MALSLWPQSLGGGILQDFLDEPRLCKDATVEARGPPCLESKVKAPSLGLLLGRSEEPGSLATAADRREDLHEAGGFS